jgi:hypothetical protein
LNHAAQVFEHACLLVSVSRAKEWQKRFVSYWLLKGLQKSPKPVMMMWLLRELHG